MSMSGSSSNKELVETSHTYHYYQVGFSNHRPKMSSFPFLHDVQDQPHPTTSLPFRSFSEFPKLIQNHPVPIVFWGVAQ